ncbi:MAG: hypothetical protein HOC71_07310 [Candidatus Latescibacteria bacterium]|jgi:2',3'-cyclic-nucleotide 2'-phosphodiesterase (5'-nucleotidase family)|nr:hypothetical protein [Candidatus Latescibacterota bacterium]
MKKKCTDIFFLSVLILFTSCSGKSGDKNIESESLISGRFTIVYSGNVGGKIEPCGCRPPLGGLAKRATVINQIRSEAKDILVLDSGALFFSGLHLYPPNDYILKLYARTIRDISSGMGLDALNVSAFDLADSPDSLLAFANAMPSKFLSANIVWKGTENLIFEPNTSFTVGKFRIGVFGLIAQKSFGMNIFTDDAPVSVLDPVETARKEVAKLKEKSDIVIALAYMDIKNVKALIAEVPGINIIVLSHTNPHRPTSDHNIFNPMLVNNTIIVRCPDGGRVLGRLDIDVINGSTEFANKETDVVLKPVALREKEGIFEKSNFLNTFIDLVGDIEDDQSIKELVEKAKKIEQAYKDSMGLNKI